MGDDITDREMLQKNIEEFSRIQRYMRMADKNSELYEELKERRKYERKRRENV